MNHVLVIEDMYLMGQLLKDVALLAGASSVAVETTEKGAVASAKISLPRLILSDVDLDEGSGPSAVTTIVAEHGPIPVIFITGNVDRCAGYPAASAILSKPTTPHQLLTAIHHAGFRGSARELN
jgi:CheY-like chemotaxis protein